MVRALFCFAASAAVVAAAPRTALAQQTQPAAPAQAPIQGAASAATAATPPPPPPPPPAPGGGPPGPPPWAGGPHDHGMRGPHGDMGGPGGPGPGGMGGMDDMREMRAMHEMHEREMQQTAQRHVDLDVQSTRRDTVIEKRVSVTESRGAWLIVPTRSTDAVWQQVCVTPCRVGADRYATYRVSSENGVTASAPFTLPQGDGPASLRVDAGNVYAHHLGQALVVAGLAATIVGASLLVAAPHVVDHDREKNTRLAGFITGGAGIVLMGIGIPIAGATRSRVYAGDGHELTCHHDGT